MSNGFRQHLLSEWKLVLSFCVLSILGTSSHVLAQPPVIPPPRPLASLKTVQVPLPSNLNEFVKDREAAIMLGKAFFWDMQVGSDGKTACASCHWHAGADARFTNSLAPPKEFEFTQTLGDPLKTVRKGDYPFIKLTNPDPNDPTDPYLNPNSQVTSRRNEVLGSQGVQTRDFTAIQIWRAVDLGRVRNDPIFSVHGTNLRTVTTRNSPTVINAVFNHRQNWDGRASFYFNGVNHLGKDDPDAFIYESQRSFRTTFQWVRSRVGSTFVWLRRPVTTSTDSLRKVKIAIDNASLASQAVEPPTLTEMSWIGRPMPELGRKLLNNRPLAKQQVYFTDSVLAPYAIYFGKGLWVDYGTLIRRAFNDKYWNSRRATEDGYTQMEANFSLFWGLSLLMYQSTLVSDESPMDRFLEGDTTAISQAAQIGKFVFEGNGNPAGGCNICHSGPETTAASIGEIVQLDGNQRQVSIMTRRPPGQAPTFFTPFSVPTLYDRGFYNLGIAPTTEDVANGGTSIFGPLSDVARLAIGRATWTFMLREDGSTLCDVYVVCAGDEYLLFSEGVCPAEVLEVLTSETAAFSAKVEDISQDVALIGLDGPFAWELLKDTIGVRVLGLRYLEFLENQPLGNGNAYVIRAGKTGEFGYQVMVPVADAAMVWAQLLEAGKKFDIAPAGYETTNLCRLENRFINMHCEGKEAKNTLELNCRVMVDREKEDYIGCTALSEMMSSEVEHRIIGLRIDGDASATPALGAVVSAEGVELGRVVNAGYSPTLGKPIALALMSAEVAFVGLDFEVQLTDGTGAASSVSAPFIFNRSLTVRPQEDSYLNR